MAIAEPLWSDTAPDAVLEYLSAQPSANGAALTTTAPWFQANVASSAVFKTTSTPNSAHIVALACS